MAVVTARHPLWPAAVLAVFKAGGCYLPLEPEFPASRIARTLTRSACRWVLSDPDVPSLDEALNGRDTIRRLTVGDLARGDGPTRDPGLAVAGDQLAYVYFTSGSTGEPKGAMCEHDGFLNHLYAKIEDLGVQEGDTVGQTAPQCFDISLWQLVSPLLVGGRVLLVEQEAVLDVARFVDLVNRHRVQVLQLVPTYLELVLAEAARGRAALPHLRVMAVTGEALKKELVRRWFQQFPGVPLVNCYGLTEVSDDSHPRRHAHRAGPPLGAARRHHPQLPRLRHGRTAPPRPRRRPGRDRHRRCVRRPRLRQRPRPHRRRLPPGPPAARRTPLPHRRLRPPAPLRRTGVPGPARRPGEDQRIPHRDRRDRGPAAPGPRRPRRCRRRRRHRRRRAPARRLLHGRGRPRRSGHRTRPRHRPAPLHGSAPAPPRP